MIWQKKKNQDDTIFHRENAKSKGLPLFVLFHMYVASQVAVPTTYYCNPNSMKRHNNGRRLPSRSQNLPYHFRSHLRKLCKYTRLLSFERFPSSFLSIDYLDINIYVKFAYLPALPQQHR
mmetsp:Transcript_35069/g.84643  ORF Transcript_35069/g.84643 Transcript_35069/m.84643 type:complete len:120 (-) Transcript_35069:379-738(-)